MDGELDRLTTTSYEERESLPFQGRVYQVRHDEKGNRVSFLKVLSGTLKVKEEVATLRGPRKIDELRHYQGGKVPNRKKRRSGRPVRCDGPDGNTGN